MVLGGFAVELQLLAKLKELVGGFAVELIVSD